MLKKLFGFAAVAACTAMVAGCDKTPAGSASASADKAAREAKDAQDKSLKELRDKEAAEKAKAEKDAKDKDAANKVEAARREETAKLVAAKELTGKLFDVPKVEEAIGKLPADKMPDAKNRLADFKKMWGDYMNEMDSSKLGEWKDKLTKAYDDLKKAAGL